MSRHASIHHRISRPARGAAAAAAVLAAGLLASTSAFALNADALPAGGSVVSGAVGISQSGNAMSVQQGSDRGIVNWQSFNIGSAASVTFHQPSAASVTLNRVTGVGASQIDGRLSANGQVYLVNPSGVTFGATAQVNAGGIIASTRDISNQDFNAGRQVFSGTGGGAVINHGVISAAPGGTVALIGGTVVNTGTINAPSGHAVLAAGQTVTMAAGADGHLQIEVDPGTAAALVNNGGLIKADGGQVVMTAEAVGAAVSSVVANTGTVQAQTMAGREGDIRLLAGMDTGTVKVDGALDASAPAGGDGGFVETSAANVKVADGARVTTLAAAGQTGGWLIDPNDFTISPTGDISGSALESILTTTNFTIHSTAGHSSGNGDIIFADVMDVPGAGATLTLVADRNVTISGSIDMAGTLNLIADSAGTGIGTVSFPGTIYNATVNAYYHPATTYDVPLTVSGGGTVHSYILISNVGQLQRISENLAGNYVVNADIDASGVSFVPIGTIGIPFTGTFNGGSLVVDSGSHVTIDGPGHVIDGLTINRPGAYVGLFSASTGTISNIGLINADIAGLSSVGALVGYQSGGTITNAFSNGTVTGTGSYTGGLVGQQAAGATLTSSYSAAGVTGNAFAGGLVGVANGTVANSYSTGAVTAASYPGGLIGNLTGNLSNSYSTGLVTTSTPYRGGLIGTRSGDATVTDAYWDADSSGQSNAVGVGPDDGITALHSATGTVNAYTQAAYASFDFGSTWWMIDGSTRPILRSEYNTTIHTSHQLQLMAMDLGAAYLLGNDIDLASAFTADDNGGYGDIWGPSGFVPIGAGTSFTGSFDGQSHAINGLTIDSGDSGVGLFGSTAGASVSNLTLSNVSITGNIQVGAAIGDMRNSTLTNVHATGTVTGSEAGGLVGWLISSSISNSSSAVAVSGEGDLGGLVGYAYAPVVNTISDSYATGSVTSTGTGGSVAGLVGAVDVSNLILTNVYASGAVSGVHAAATGGLAVIGEPHATITVNGGVYWDSVSTGQASAIGGEGTVSGDIDDVAGAPRSELSYAGFDFTGPWVILEGETRPMLRSEYSTTIYTPHQLQLMALDLGAGYKLGANLDLAPVFDDGSGHYGDVWGASGFVPVGSSGAPFTGRFDGQGHAIANLAISRAAATNYTGLFGYASGAAISNITLSGGGVTGGSNLGALIGYMLNGTLTNASSGVTVTALYTGEDDVGGLVGVNDGGTISLSSASGDVTGAGYNVGGLVGYNRHGGAIRQSYATGAVTSTNISQGYVGGLVGLNGYFAGVGDGGTISQSYATGTVTGAAGPIGGFIGHNMGAIDNSYATGAVIGGSNAQNVGGFAGVNGPEGTITGAYSTGYVSGTASNIGGFAGYNNNDASALTSVYWDTGTSGQATGLSGGAGTVIGLTTAQLQAGLPAGFDASIWASVPGQSYPYLKWEFPTGTPQVIAGTVYTDGGSTRAGGGVTVTGLYGTAYTDPSVMGLDLNSAQTGGTVRTGANGYYYFLLAPGTIPDAGAVFTYAAGYGSGGDIHDGAAMANSFNGYAGSLDILGDALHIQTGSQSLFPNGSDPGVYEGLYTALGPGHFYLVAGGLGIPDMRVDAYGDFTIDAPLATFYPHPGNVIVTAAGDLTIGAGGFVSGENVILAAGGSFTNLAGAGAIDTSCGCGSGGHWLVYAANPVSAAAADGLSPDFAQYGASFPVGSGFSAATAYTGAAAPALSDANGFLYSVTPTLGLTVTKTYDGTTGLPGDDDAYSLSGALNGDIVGADASGVSGDFSSANAGSGKTVTLSGLTVVATTAEGVPIYGYAGPVTGAGTIDKALLTVTASGQDKIYDGTTDATVTYGDNRVAGDDLDIASIAAFADKNAGTGKTVNVGGITVTGADAGNYIWNTVTTTVADIAQRALTIIASGQDKIYDGTTDATVTYGDDRVAGDDLDIASIAAFAGKSAGAGKTVSVSGIAVTGADAGNYIWNTTAMTMGSIQRRSLVVAALDASRSTSDDNPSFGYSVGGLGLAPGDSASDVFSGALSASTSRQPGRYAITQGSLTADGDYIMQFIDGILTVRENAPGLTGGDLSRAVQTSLFLSGVSLAGDTPDSGMLQNITPAGSSGSCSSGAGCVPGLQIAPDYIRMP